MHLRQKFERRFEEPCKTTNWRAKAVRASPGQKRLPAVALVQNFFGEFECITFREFCQRNMLFGFLLAKHAFLYEPPEFPDFPVEVIVRINLAVPLEKLVLSTFARILSLRSSRPARQARAAGW